MDLGSANIWICKVKDKYTLYANDYPLATFTSEVNAQYLAGKSGIEIIEYGESPLRSISKEMLLLRTGEAKL